MESDAQQERLGDVTRRVRWVRALVVIFLLGAVSGAVGAVAWQWMRLDRRGEAEEKRQWRRREERMSGYVIQGYYPYWVSSSVPPSVVAFEELTHVSHAFVWPEADGRLHVPRRFEPGEVVRRARASGCKVILCVGGGGANSRHFRDVTSNEVTRSAFVERVCAYVASNGYDGVEVNWEFPRSEGDGSNLVKLVRELRGRLGKEKVVSVTVNGSRHGSEYIDVGRLRDIVDYFPVMTYDYHGKWSKVSGHNAPLESYEGTEGDVRGGMMYWVERGLPREKMLLGLAFYGRSFDAGGIGERFERSGATMYGEIALLRGNGYERRWDATARVPYLVADGGGKVISYDDLVSLSMKVDYAKAEGFGGVMIWHVAGDVEGGRHWLLRGVAARVRGARLLAGVVKSEDARGEGGSMFSVRGEMKK